MRLRTFTAPDMPAAMKMIREALGENAIILNADSHKGRKGVIVTAAVDPDDELLDELPAKPKKPERKAELPSGNIDNLRFEIQNILRFHNLPELFVARIMQKATPKALSAGMGMHHISSNRDETQLLKAALEKLMEASFRFEPLAKNASRIMLVGPPGIGKTLTIAKLAAKICMGKHKLAVITTDNKRAGGIEQLQAFTTILGLDLMVTTNAGQLERTIATLPDDMPLLIDTAGCNPYEQDELSELNNYVSASGSEPILTLPCGGDSLETIDIVEAFTVLPIKKLLITRADAARRFGSVLAAAASCDLAFCGLSNSSSIIDALEPLDGQMLAELLLQYKLKT